MSCSYYVTFHRKPTDPDWVKKVAAVRALEEAGCAIPEELKNYFGIRHVDLGSIEESLQWGVVWVDDSGLPKVIGVTRKNIDSGNTVEIDLDSLPKDIKIIRVRLGC